MLLSLVIWEVVFVMDKRRDFRVRRFGFEF